MICNIASDISTRLIVWTVTDLSTGRYIECVPSHLVSQTMYQLNSSLVGR